MEENNSKEEVPSVDANISSEMAALKLEEENAKKEALEKAIIEERYKMFRNNFSALQTILNEIINKRKSDLIELKKVVIELDCLSKYLIVYEKTNAVDHYDYFSNVYNRYREEILSGNDTWITASKKPIVIQFGEGIKALEGKVNNAKIMITDIFNMALELKHNSEEAIKGTNLVNESADFYYPIIIKYHLYCIFYYLMEPSDKDRKPLGLIINEFEKQLDIETRTYTEPVSASSNTGISAIFNMAKGVMGKMGVDVGNVPAPNEADIMTVFTNVLNNDKTQNMMKGIFSSLQNSNPKDIGGTLNNIVQGISNPESMAILQETVANTSKELHKNHEITE